MNRALAHIDEFLQNAEDIMKNLNRDLEYWKMDEYNQELINRILIVSEMKTPVI
jgi:hypothetical protein